MAALLTARLPVAKVNAKQVRQFAKACGQLSETDRIDAFILADYGRRMETRTLPDQDIEKHGFIADSSKTYLVGNAPPAAKRLVRVGQEAIWKGIRHVGPEHTLGDRLCNRWHAKRNGYSVVREYCGHGIGREMHEEPQVPISDGPERA